MEIFAIDMLTALKLLFRTGSQAYCAIVTTMCMETVTKIKLHMETSLASSLCLFANSYRLFKKFNRAPLNYSLEALCRFPGGGYTHAALETV